MIGLVGAIGADLDQVTAALTKSFETVSYATRTISLIELVVSNKRWRPTVAQKTDARYDSRMDAGNEFRELLRRNDALALMGMAAIRSERLAVNGDADKAIPRCAFILRSLKTEEEVERLRETYGPNCLIVAAYLPKADRVKRLARRIADSYHSEWSQHKDKAERLVTRDENERGKTHGQNVRDTFPLADVFLDTTDQRALERDALRFVEILFAHPFRTPTRDEFAMFQAYGAALCSSSAGRQVGACIATADGDVVAMGTNEVAKAFGGQYWDGDDGDQRDHQRSSDSTFAMTQSILADLLSRLRKQGWLNDTRSKQELEDLLNEARRELLGRMVVGDGEPASLAEKAQLSGIIEFIRAVHAEMAALMSAARRGVSVEDCTLYSTSFPCHECARHIVAAGIKKVRFIEPYPKSRVLDLYDDSIVVDAENGKRVPFIAFVGLAPRLFVDFFAMPKRKGQDGKWVSWDEIRSTQEPRLANPPGAYLEKEQDWVVVLDETCKTNGLDLSEES